jgi:hypothetical protein
MPRFYIIIRFTVDNGRTIAAIVKVAVDHGNADSRFQHELQITLGDQHGISGFAKEVVYHRIGAEGEVDGDAESLLNPSLVVVCKAIRGGVRGRRRESDVECAPLQR